MKKLNKYMDKWYGQTWLRDSIILLACLINVPVLVGSLG